MDGAVFGEKLGWERPNLYADPDAAEQQRDIYTSERPNWHAAAAVSYTHLTLPTKLAV